MSTAPSTLETVIWTLEYGHRHVVDKNGASPDGKHVELTAAYQAALRRGDKHRCAELRRQWQTGTFGRYKAKPLTEAQKAARAENIRRATAARMERKKAEKAAWNDALMRRLKHEGERAKNKG
jgi:dTDP-glucose pyrophosphorylase